MRIQIDACTYMKGEKREENIEYLKREETSGEKDGDMMER